MSVSYIFSRWRRVESDELVRLGIDFRRTKVFGRNIRVGDVYLGSHVSGVGRRVVVADPHGQVALQGPVAETNRSYLVIDEVIEIEIKITRKIMGEKNPKQKYKKRTENQ